MAGRQWIREALKDFVFSFSQGAAAAAKTPGARGGAASLAASLQAPQLRQDMIRQRTIEDEERQQKMEQLRRAATLGDQQQIKNMIDIFANTEGPQMSVPRPTTQQAPLPQMGAGNVLEPQANVPAPQNMGMRNIATGSPSKMQIGGLTVQPLYGNQIRDRAMQEKMQLDEAATQQNITQNAPQLAAQERTRRATEESNDLTRQALQQERERQEANRIADNARADRALAQTKEIADANRAAADARAARTANAKIAEIEAAKARGELTPAQSSTALRLSNALKSHPAYTDMLDIATGMQGVETGLAQKNGFGDITAINSFQRMVDPGATVRSEDVTLLSSARGVLDMINTQYPIDKLQSGAKLPEAVRARMLATAKALHEKRGKNYNDTVGNQYRKLAEASGIPFDYVGVDFAIGGAQPGGTGEAAPAAPAGVDPAVWNVMTPQERALWRN